jgi:hypothetical protein
MSALIGLALFSAVDSGRAQVPANCTFNRSSLDLGVLTPCITNGGTARFHVDYENNNLGGNQDGCNVVITNSGFFCYDANGNVNLGSSVPLLPVVPTEFPFGFPLTPIGDFSCTVTLNPGVNVAKVRAEFFGRLRSNAGETADGGAFKEITVAVFRPNIEVTKECVNQCTPYGQPILFRGSVRNSGDERLINVTVVDNLGGPQILRDAANNPLPVPVSLAPGATAFFSGQHTPPGSGAALCGPFRNIATATGVGDCTLATRIATDDAICHVQTAPAIDLTKTCGPVNPPCDANLPNSVRPGEQYFEQFVVRNTGNIALRNVVVHDTVGGVTTDINIFTATGSTCLGATQLDPGQSCTVRIIKTAPANNCSPITDRAVASGDQICPPDATCPSPATVTSAERSCTVVICCRPCIRITEEVVCIKPDTLCDAFTPNPNDQTNACGMRNETSTDCSAFCFKIVIEAICIDGTPSPVPATGIRVTSKLDLSGCNFPTTLQPGAMAMCIIPAVTLCTNFTDIVTVTITDGVPDADDTDSVSVVIKPIAVHCVSTFTSSMDMEDPDSPNCVMLPEGSVDVPVTLTTTIFNDSDVDLVVTVNNLPPLVDCADDVTPIVITQPIAIPARGTHVITGCYLADCENISFDITVRGTVDTNSPNADCRCFYNRNGRPIMTSADDNDHCLVCVTCVPAVTCRTTGGGTLYPGFVDQSCIPVVTQIFPSAGVDHISHGGQLGAPFSQMDCGAILGNPCIRGQWEHVRHYQGNGNPRDVIDMNFHSTTPKGVFDSLSCACLGCCDPVTGAFIPPVTGPLVHKFAICNPDDHKMCGPQPRPAPANALIFSGIGRITPTDDINGPRANRSEWVIFRVYIEDRSEPGGGHPDPSFPTEPADIYCFQAWKTGIKTTRKPDFTTISTAFRMALGQANCDFLHALETGALPIGTLPSPTVNGQTADIQDCGPLHDGNRQIHPATGATCDE